MTTVKICGLMRPGDVGMCVRHGAGIIGFVVDYPHPVPWNLDAIAAKKLIGFVCGRAKSCVVTGGPPEKTVELVAKLRPDYVQLHCGESLADTAAVANGARKYGVKIIKTLFPDTPEPEKAAGDFHAAGADMLLLDPRTPQNAAAGGSADLLGYVRLRAAVSCPVILAGGITPQNAAGLVRDTGAEIIDLMTGVEDAPGVKSEEKVISLFKALENKK